MRYLNAFTGGAMMIGLRAMGTSGVVLAVCGLVGFVLVFAGVILPAVWSSRPARRAAALAVLRVLRRGRAQGP
jgi:hypothetical protein